MPTFHAVHRMFVQSFTRRHSQSKNGDFMAQIVQAHSGRMHQSSLEKHWNRSLYVFSTCFVCLGFLYYFFFFRWTRVWNKVYQRRKDFQIQQGCFLELHTKKRTTTKKKTKNKTICSVLFCWWFQQRQSTLQTLPGYRSAADGSARQEICAWR